MNIRKLVAACVVSLAGVSGTAVAQQTAFPMVTIADIGRPYTVLDGTCVQGIAPGITMSDPFGQTLNNAVKAIIEQGKKAGADGLVGMQVAFESTDGGGRGRVVICGTFVKFK